MRLLTFIFLLAFLFSNEQAKAQNFVPFDWKYPEYGSHSLNALEWIADESFIAVGDEGMILLSFDNGETWVMRQQQTLRDFKAIYVIDNLKIFALASFDNSGTELYMTEDGGDTWSIIYENESVGMQDVFFLDELNGYMAGSIGKMLKTENGGSEWTEIGNTFLNGTLTSVWFINSDTGYVGKTNSQGMYKTEDGGTTWSQNFGYFPSSCYTIKFINDSIGWAGAFGDAIYKTTNGGVNWAQANNPNLSTFIRSIAFQDSARGIAISNSYIYRTNNGQTWTSNFAGSNQRSCAMSPDGRGIVTDVYGGIIATDNLGFTSTDINPQSGLSVFRRIHFLNNDLGWVGGDDGKILKTTDGGESWILMEDVPYYSSIYDMAVVNANKVLIVNNDGTVVSTSNGGNSFSEQTLLADEWLRAISFPTASVGYIGGEAGRIWKTTNGGTSYILTENTDDDEDIYDLSFTSASNGFLVDEFSRIKKTVNGGITWTDVNTSGIGAVSHVYAINENFAYFINENGDVSRTVDGETTEFLGETCISTPFDLQFINDSTGFAVGSLNNTFCDVAFTSDSGATWSSMTFPFAYAGWGVFAFDTNTVFLVGQSQSIIRSGEGEIVTSIQKSEGHETSLVYPNPSQGVIRIHEGESFQNWELINLQGQLVKTGNQRIISLEEFPNGIYLLKLNAEKQGFSMTKVILNR